MNLYRYDNNFYAYQQVGALASARAVAPHVLHHLKPSSILDVGCGAGAWMAAYLESGLQHVMGVDGDYVQAGQLVVDASHFRPLDVSRPFHLARRFDVVHCLEVAEHLDPTAGEVLVDNLVAHAPTIVFSAAPPGQGGENHVNERPYEYWRDRFAERGYALFDFIRPLICLDDRVEYWYRYNMLAFVHEEAIAALNPGVAATRIDGSLPVPDYSPPAWRARRKVLSLLPANVVTSMARLKHRLAARNLHAEAQA